MISNAILVFRFEEDTRKYLVFSEPEKIRMDPQRGRYFKSESRKLSKARPRKWQKFGREKRLQVLLEPGLELRLNSNKYSTDEWLSVRSQTFTPTAIRKWTGFDHQANIPANTSILYRLGTELPGGGEEEYIYDAGWRIALEPIKSTATLDVVDFNNLSDETYTINGKVRKEGEQWTAGSDDNTTAQSIANDINKFSFVVATVIGSLITITASAAGVIGDTITLASSDAINLIPSGPTLTNGQDAEFNDLNTIQDNIDTFLVFAINDRSSNTSIFVRANLKTTNSEVTPLLSCVKILGEFEVEWLEDIIYNTVIQDMHNKLRFSFDLEFEMPVTTDTMDLALDNFSPDNEGYNIVEIESVYDMTVDPNRLVNLFDSYAPGALNEDNETNAPGVITLTSAIPLGNVMWAKIIVVPEFAVNTDQDFYELRKYPAISFEKIDRLSGTSSTMKYTHQLDGGFVRNFSNGTAVEIQPPAIDDLRFEFSVFTSNQIDLQRLMNSLRDYFTENRVIRRTSLDDEITMIFKEELSESQKPDLNDVNTATGKFDLLSVPFYIKKSKIIPLITNVNLDITTD